MFSSPNLFAEEYIDGREFNISLLLTDDGVQILPHAEIHFDNYPPDKYKIVDYEAKWVHDSFAYENTNRSFSFTQEDRPILDEIDRISLQLWDIFKLNGYARIDFRVKNNEVFVLEVNANPCISIYSGFMAAVREYGLSFSQALDIIIKHPIISKNIYVKQMKHLTKNHIQYRDFPVHTDCEAIVSILDATGFFLSRRDRYCLRTH